MPKTQKVSSLDTALHIGEREISAVFLLLQNLPEGKTLPCAAGIFKKTSSNTFCIETNTKKALELLFPL